jgi:hypothetical protein
MSGMINFSTSDRILILPVHYRDDDPNTRHKGALCPFSGTYAKRSGAYCPLGCSGATEHYANDGHPECEEP